MRLFRSWLLLPFVILLLFLTISNSIGRVAASFEDDEDDEDDEDARSQESITELQEEKEPLPPSSAHIETTLIMQDEREEAETIENVENHFNGCTSRYKGRSPGIIVPTGSGTPPNMRVQYLHIQKAGGTSIQNAMRGWYERGDSRIRMFTFNGPVIGKSPEKCPKLAMHYSVLAGHRPFGFCGTVANSKDGLFVFTALREPVSRMISIFDYQMYNQESPKFRSFFPRGIDSLSELILAYNATDNVTEEGEARFRTAGMQQTRFMCGFECVRGNLTDREMMKRAKQNVLKLGALSITERLRDLIPQLKFHLTFVPPGFSRWPEDNTAKRRTKSKVSPEARAVLASWAQMDVELYSFAKERYLRMFERVKRCNSGSG